MNIPPYVAGIKEIAPLFEKADVVDIKTAESSADMRQFIAKLLAYQPAWVTFLYGVRMVFVRFLGMRQGGIPKMPHLAPEDVPMEPDQPAAFFKVAQAQEDRFWFVDIQDDHLDAALGVVVEPLPDGKNRYYVITLVYYNKWTGPVYFNVIRPFHHLVVRGMMRNGVMA